MRAIVFERHGGLEVLEQRRLVPPECAADEALLHIQATGMNFTDVWARRGMSGVDVTFPHISGCEASGIVERVGESVTNVKAGDQVLVNAGIACGMCPACQRCNPFACAGYAIWGF